MKTNPRWITMLSGLPKASNLPFESMLQKMIRDKTASDRPRSWAASPSLPPIPQLEVAQWPQAQPQYVHLGFDRPKI